MVRDWSWIHDALEASLLVWYRPSIQHRITLRYFQVWRLTWRRTLVAWIYVPIGILCVLLACWGVDSLIGLSSVSFPASVALLIVLFFALILCESILGSQRTKKIVQVIDIPVSYQHTANLGFGLILLGWVCSSLYQCVLHSFFWFVTCFQNILVHEAIAKGFNWRAMD